ncbi:MAG TPA: thioredoxin family protein [Methanomicrobia archaeon]|nr:thioredoxin family protein [Methanomicrobia archaeon]
MKIEVLGAGCAKCRATKKVITRVIQELHLDAKVVEVADVAEVVNRGVMVTPGVFVDGKLKSTGRVPTKDEITGWLSARSEESAVAETTATTQTEGLCACLHYAMGQARLGKKKHFSLHTITCKRCGKSFSCNIPKDYCFECEKELSER